MMSEFVRFEDLEVYEAVMVNTLTPEKEKRH